MRNILFSLVSLILGISIFSSCESMDETNTDPTRMDQATAGSFLNPVLYNMTSYNWSRYNGWTFVLMQSCVSTSSTSGTGWFHIADAAGDGTWTNGYKWINNAKSIYNYAEKYDKSNYKAISLTLQAWMFQILTESFGDIPFDEACLADSGIVYPKFNKQIDVYKGILAYLEKADTLYKPSEGLIYNSNGDMMYCSSSTDATGISLWKKFTNSLRLRILLRLIDVPEFDAVSQIKTIVNNPDLCPLISSNEESAKVHISGVSPEEQPMTRLSDLTSYRYYSEFFINKLKEWNDPRLPVWANQVTNDGIKGFYGIESGYKITPGNNGSQPIAANIAAAPMDLQIMSYSELMFIKAELVQRGIIDGDAKQFYEKAVEASMEQWGVTLPDGYFDNVSAAYDGTLERIMQQKFYALFFCDYQQWFEFTRTGYPKIPIGPDIDEADKMPLRFKYPAVLQRTNKDNYEIAKQSMGGDDFNNKLIWQK